MQNFPEVDSWWGTITRNETGHFTYEPLLQLSALLLAGFMLIVVAIAEFTGSPCQVSIVPVYPSGMCAYYLSKGERRLLHISECLSCSLPSAYLYVNHTTGNVYGLCNHHLLRHKKHGLKVYHRRDGVPIPKNIIVNRRKTKDPFGRNSTYIEDFRLWRKSSSKNHRFFESP
jgi:hypothetical protein